MKQRWLDRNIDWVFPAYVALMVVGLIVSIVGMVVLERQCHAKGGAYIDGECVRLERIP